MRELTGHSINPVNDQIKIEVMDEPGAGGACHHYQITIPGSTPLSLQFQNGPIAEAGVNGITQEVLLEILIDRLEGFQSGKFACKANNDALVHIHHAKTALLERTKERMERGVEGTHQL
jgi:hypothetical protein